MDPIKKMENLIAIILTIGTLISVSLTLVGGTLFLMQHGHDYMQSDLVALTTSGTTLTFTWKSIFSFTPINMINLGLLVLVFIQILRVALLGWFYYSIKDKWFTFISIFILLILLYSFIWRI